MISAGIKDIMNNLSRLLTRVKAGEEILITERGRPVARIVKENQGDKSIRAALDPLVQKGLIVLTSRGIQKDHLSTIEVPGKPVSDMVLGIDGDRVMILYLDTSALVKRYFRGPFSDELLATWRSADQIVTYSVAYAEAMASTQRKKQEAGLPDALLREIVSSFHQDGEPIRNQMESPPEPERRKMQHFDLRLPAWLKSIGPETERKVPVTTRDISADGAFFFTNEPLEVGASIAACVVLPAREGRRQMPDKTGVNFKGQVVRVEMSGVAVRFNRQWEVVFATDNEDFFPPAK